MKDIIALRVKTSAIHSAAQLESTVLEEVLNLKTVLQGHLLKARNRLCVVNVLRASTAYQNLLSQVSLVLPSMTVLKDSTVQMALAETGKSVQLALTAVIRT